MLKKSAPANCIARGAFDCIGFRGRGSRRAVEYQPKYF